MIIKQIIELIKGGQCEKTYPHYGGALIYCVRRKGHFGSCRAYNGTDLSALYGGKK